MVLPVVFLKTAGPEALALVCAAMFLFAAFEFMLVPGLGGAVRQIPLSLDDARERFAEAWDRLASDSVSYIAVVMVVLASTTSLVVVTLLPRYSTKVLGVNSENAIFLVTPAAAGIWLALRFVRRVSGRYSPSWTIGLSFGALVAGVMVLAFIRPIGAMVSDANPLGLFDPGPLARRARGSSSRASSPRGWRSRTRSSTSSAGRSSMAHPARDARAGLRGADGAHEPRVDPTDPARGAAR